MTSPKLRTTNSPPLMTATLSAVPADPCEITDRRLTPAEHDSWIAHVRQCPMTHEQINARMSQIQAAMSAYRFTYHLNVKTLMGELDYLRSVYDAVLTGRRTQP